MNRLKSIFITAYISFLFIGLIYNGIQFFSERSEVKYLAGALVNLLPIVFFAYLFLKKPSNVKGGTLIVTALIGTTFLITTGRTLFEIHGLDLVFALSITSIVGWALYLMWYSKFNNRDRQELLGSTLTELKFKDAQNNSITLAPDDNNFHILLFHRGNWCPLCVAQIRDITKQYQDMAERKVAVHIISPVNSEWTNKLSAKFDVKFNFLIDDNLQVAKDLGIFHANGLPFGFQVLGFDTDTILPTVFLLDKKLKVLRIHETDDYKQRPEPDFFLRLIDSY